MKRKNRGSRKTTECEKIKEPRDFSDMWKVIKDVVLEVKRNVVEDIEVSKSMDLRFMRNEIKDVLPRE